MNLKNHKNVMTSQGMEVLAGKLLVSRDAITRLTFAKSQSRKRNGAYTELMSHYQQYHTLFNELVTHTRSLNLSHGRSLHARIIKSGFSSNSFLSNALVHFYAKCGFLPHAELAFSEIAHKDIVSWNSLINSYSQKASLHFSSLVMDTFSRMRADNTLPNSRTFSGIFTAAANLAVVDSGGREAHCLAIKTNCCEDVFVGSALVNMYCKAGLVRNARNIFDEMPERNSVSWTTMISGYAIKRMAREAVDLFRLLMETDLERENEYIVTSVLSALTDPELIDVGRQVHSTSVKDGLICIGSVTNALLTMYTKCGSLEDAFQMFEMSNDRNSITWSAMVTAFAQSGNPEKALNLFSRLNTSGTYPTEHAFVGVINSCSDTKSIEQGKQVHSYSLKMGFQHQMYIATALVDMYSKCGFTNDAKKGFNSLTQPDTVLWTSMISGHVQNDENESALSLYEKMEADGILPNEVTMASVLKACSSLAALEHGKQVHGRVIKYGFSSEIQIGSALSTMYAKGGCVEEGNLVFQRIAVKDVVSWNSMISGFAQNGRNKEALDLFEEMTSEGVSPDEVTFVNILSACSHMGLVERSWEYFDRMSSDFKIVPKLDHYACMVDVLTRAGRLNEAKLFIESATIDHGMCLWRILISGCKNYGEYELGAYAGERLMELGSQESSAYVMLSSIYTALGKKDDVGRVMRLMKQRGISKEPGCSWIELKNVVHVFVMGDQIHPQMGDIYHWLRILTNEMMDQGYSPASSLSHARVSCTLFI